MSQRKQKAARKAVREVLATEDEVGQRLREVVRLGVAHTRRGEVLLQYKNANGAITTREARTRVTDKSVIRRIQRAWLEA